MFKRGIATYFKEFAFKNSTLDDFMRHIKQAATELKIGDNFGQWAESWLKTAGCSVIWHEIEEENGKIKKFVVH